MDQSPNKSYVNEVDLREQTHPRIDTMHVRASLLVFFMNRISLALVLDFTLKL